MKVNRKQLGDAGEQYVAYYLEQRGFTILARNYRKRYGEIDLIMGKGDLLAFVEVKTRTYHHIDPAEIIVHAKQRKISMTAQAFIAEHNYTDKVCRFDVAFVTCTDGGMKLDYLPNAFVDEGE